jgi:hypothetical protein
MRTPFSERAEVTGLTAEAHKGLYSYSDRYSEIVYRQLVTILLDTQRPQYLHKTDGVEMPMMAIFTKAPDDDEYKYCGTVSDFYQFMGNDVLNERIRAAVQAVGMPIVTENCILSYDLTRMRTELIIQSSQNVPNAGDVLPVMIVQNSYNGTKAASLSFGIATYVNRERVTFGFSLGEMRQIHIVNSNTEMASAINTYMGVFTENIADMITQSFSSELSEQEMLGVLDVVEGFGKKRREAVSTLLDEIQTASGNRLPTSWQMFLAIVRYSSFEPNLNIKKLMENAAESVLVIPPRMFDVLDRLQTS